MGRDRDGNWQRGWQPPQYEVDDDGKVVGFVNSNEPNNWGRWGTDDEVGTLNHISAATIRDAADLIEHGTTFSLAIPLEPGGPRHPSRPDIVHLHAPTGGDLLTGARPVRRFGRYQPTDDYILMPVQGTTQWDALSHIGQDDVLYNGYWIGAVGSYGAERGSIHHLRDRIVGRGVLLDLPRHLGVDRLEPGFAVHTEILEACVDGEGVEVRTGDILLVRTGHVPWYYTLRDRSEFWTSGAPGLAADTVDWLHERQVAAVAVDNVAVEVEPFDGPPDVPYPLHVRLIRDLGMTLGELWWLEDLADWCATHGRYTCFLSAPPLYLRHGSGSMLNPLAIV